MTNIQNEIDNLKKEAQEESPKALAYLESARNIEIKKLEGYAKRNWDAIKKLSRATTIVLTMLVIGLLVSGLVSIRLSGRTNNLTNRISVEEAHTKEVQVAGAPTGVCLREAMKAGEPIIVSLTKDLQLGIKSNKVSAASKYFFVQFLNLFKKVKNPLDEYVKLQDKRYKGVICS